MEMKIKARRWQDQLILLLGFWLIATPWIYAYPQGSSQMSNAIISGIVIAVLAAFDLYKTCFWAVGVNLLLGIWVAISPWVLQVADRRTVVWNELIVGVAVLVLALWELRTDPELHKHWPGTGTAT